MSNHTYAAGMPELRVEELSEQNQDEVRSLILDGLGDHWGFVDPTLNPDLNDLGSTYATGRTVLLRDTGGALMGTGTIVPRGGGVAEIVRMSVARAARRRGIGQRILDELVATARRWGIERVVLETTSSWEGVVSFYLSGGFAITHIVDGDFGSETWFELQLDHTP